MSKFFKNYLVLILVLLICLGALLGVMSDGFKNWDKFKTDSSSSADNDEEGNFEVNKLLSLKDYSWYYDEISCLEVEDYCDAYNYWYKVVCCYDCMFGSISDSGEYVYEKSFIYNSYELPSTSFFRNPKTKSFEKISFNVSSETMLSFCEELGSNNYYDIRTFDSMLQFDSWTGYSYVFLRPHIVYCIYDEVHNSYGYVLCDLDSEEDYEIKVFNNYEVNKNVTYLSSEVEEEYMSKLASQGYNLGFYCLTSPEISLNSGANSASIELNYVIFNVL